MRFNIAKDLNPKIKGPIVGNVYNVRGGNGAKMGHMMVIVGYCRGRYTTLTVDKDGDIVGGSSYNAGYFENKCPIAYTKNIAGMTFEIEAF